MVWLLPVQSDLEPG
jgi:hypothetical protein